MLSLDFVRPVYAELGLNVLREETLRGIARDVLSGRYSAVLLSGGGEPQIEPFTDMLAGMLGQDDADRFAFWVRYVVCTEDSNPWSLYEDLLGSWASRFRKLNVDGIGLLTDPAAVEAKFRLLTGKDEAEATLHQQRKKVLSDWDSARCAEMGLLEIPEGSDYFPFVDGVVLTIARAKFHRFWKWLMSNIMPPDILAIAAAAKMAATQRNVPYCSPEDLPLPPE